MLHFDSHPDLLIPTDLLADDTFNRLEVMVNCGVVMNIIDFYYMSLQPLHGVVYAFFISELQALRTGLCLFFMLGM